MKKLILFVLALTMMGGATTTVVADTPFKVSDIKNYDAKKKITSDDVIKYLGGYGYTNVRVVYIDADGNYLCSSAYPYLTRVYVVGDQIVGHDDVME